jgi:MoaA/NifB/PqqE/SkfB family radical SAM enzyme
MGGVILGSEMKRLVKSMQEDRLWEEKPFKIHAVDITTNCNLDCPMCYFGKRKKGRTMLMYIAKRIAEIPCAGTVLISAEPLFDDATVEIVSTFAAASRTRLITNGINLAKYASKIADIEAVDISLDGGPKTYSRSSDFSVIIEGAKEWKAITGKSVYALHTLTKDNCQNIGDMLDGSAAIGADYTFFAPMIRTIGGCDLPSMPTEEMVDLLKEFCGSGKWKVVMDPIHALLGWESWEDIKCWISELPEEHRLIFDADPGDWIERISIDGEAFHPIFPLHPGIKIPGRKLF